MNLKEKSPAFHLRAVFLLFTLCCLVAAILSPDRADMFGGLGRICMQSGQTVKSYFDAGYGGFAGTFLNVMLVSAVCTAVYFLPGVKPDGTSALAFFLTAGFCFWGTNILNIWFSMAGVLLYCLLKKKQPGTMANALLFSTGLSPLISDLLFRYPGTEWHGFTWQGILFAILVGAIIGVLLPPVLGHSPQLHKGFDLYSAAVPLGFTAFLLRVLLYKVLGGSLPESVSVGTGDTFPLVCFVFGIGFFSLCLVYGILSGGSFRGWAQLLRSNTPGADTTASTGDTVLNLGIYGIFIMLYYAVIGAKWNAATLGCVFCMVCCFAKGSNPRTVWPILLGYVLSSFAAKGVCLLLGTEFSLAINAQAIVIGACFANGLSPVTAAYGPLFGLLAGAMHYTLVTGVPLLHGGFLLYNGGFTAAIACVILIPVLEHCGVQKRG